MPDELASLLHAHTSATLNAMASFHGLAKKGPKPKMQTVPELAEALAQPQRIRDTWNDLSKPERVLVTALLQRDGHASTRALRKLLAGQKLIDPNAVVTYGGYGPNSINPRAVSSRRFEDILARLTLRGLVFAADDPPAAYPGGDRPLRDLNRPAANVFIPAAVRRHLPAPSPLETAAPEPARVGGSLDASARTFQRDLYLYWSFVRRRPLSLTAKDEPRKSDLKDLNASLLVRVQLDKGQGELDHPRLRFARLLLTALGLLRFGDDSLLQAADRSDFFALPPAERVARCFEAWRAGDFFNELLLLPPEVHPRRATQILSNADAGITAARQTVLDALTKLRPDGWTAFEALIERLRDNRYDFLFPRAPLPYSSYGYTPSVYSSEYNRLGLEFPGIRSDEAGWERVEANFIRGVVTGPLHWMGLADLGWEKAPGDAPTAFRLTALGRWVLGLGPAPEIPSEGGRVIVQPNLHVVALDPVNDATLVTLDQFAERLSAERAVEYRLTRESVYAGQQAGWDAARIREFLQQHTGAPLPGNVTRTLDEWQAGHERIVIHSNVTLAHGLPEALDGLMKHPQAGATVAARPAPEVAVLAGPEAIPVLTRALGEAGILPLVTTRDSVPANSVEATEAGEVRLLAKRPNLYLHGYLAPFADPEGEAGYRISAGSVARATRAGMGAPEILKRLEAVNRGPLPEALSRRVRAWARHYGDAALEETLLLQVRDAAALEELLADPELAPLLQPFAPSPQMALARVRPADAERLRALLAERGMQIKTRLD